MTAKVNYFENNREGIKTKKGSSTRLK